ncbi:hypothetical protein B0T22DRAFT_110761 [Podospora appendiculata]|uniref:Uncharacterized protein n=1 Tax=Podospora appendiculata TaxID=314037 RepID=A0AAE0XL83_9PEZI|nr:hypothetical protein B0T22DRAFT_110761 [Podospora appendiculata]
MDGLFSTKQDDTRSILLKHTQGMGRERVKGHIKRDGKLGGIFSSRVSLAGGISIGLCFFLLLFLFLVPLNLTILCLLLPSFERNTPFYSLPPLSFVYRLSGGKGLTLRLLFFVVVGGEGVSPFETTGDRREGLGWAGLAGHACTIGECVRWWRSREEET